MNSEITLGNKLGSGGSAEVFEYEINKIIKLYYKNIPKHIVQWEYEKTKNACDEGLPVPKVYEFVRIEDRYGFVQDKVNGKTFMSEMLAYIAQFQDKVITGGEILKSDRMIWCIKETAKILYKMHSSRADVMDTMKDTLLRMVDNNDFLSASEKIFIQEQIVGLPNGTCICHGDPNPGNIINDGRNTYLVDWISCVKGHPFYDLMEYIQMYEHIEVPEKYIEVFIEMNKEDMVHIFLEEYKNLSGIELTGLDRFYLPQLAAKLGGGCSYAKKIKILEEVHQIIYR